MTIYHKILEEALESENIGYKFVPDEQFRWHLLLEKQQKWLKPTSWVNPSIIARVLRYKGVPIWGLLTSEGLKIFDFGDNYEHKPIKISKQDWNTSKISTLKFGRQKYKIFKNYRIIPGFPSEIDKPIKANLEKFVKYTEEYKTDYLILPYEISIKCFGTSEIKFILLSREFVLKDIFLSHPIYENSNQLSLSFVANFLREFLSAWKIYCLRKTIRDDFVQLESLVYTKSAFLDVFDNKILKRFFEINKIAYKPLIGDKNIKERLSYIQKHFEDLIF
ncbi:MAG: hypothetical protein QW228_05550 [Candidatus Aenigmatarchaeota archaeon]